MKAATDEKEDCIWLTLDGPMNPELFEEPSIAKRASIWCLTETSVNCFNNLEKSVESRWFNFFRKVEKNNVSEIYPAGSWKVCMEMSKNSTYSTTPCRAVRRQCLPLCH